MKDHKIHYVSRYSRRRYRLQAYKKAGVTALMLVILVIVSTVIGVSLAGRDDQEPIDGSPDFTVSVDKPNKPMPDDSLLEEETVPPIEETTTPETIPSETVPPEINDDKIDYAPIDYYYTVSEEEREMLAKITYLEAGICGLECQKGIVSVIFNRLESGHWRKDMNGDGEVTLYDIIYYPNAFTPAKPDKMAAATPSQSCYDAVDYVLQNGPTMPPQVRYFRASYHFKWNNYIPYCDMDNVYFGYLANWKIGEW